MGLIDQYRPRHYFIQPVCLPSNLCTARYRYAHGFGNIDPMLLIGKDGWEGNGGFIKRLLRTVIGRNPPKESGGFDANP